MQGSSLTGFQGAAWPLMGWMASLRGMGWYMVMKRVRTARVMLGQCRWGEGLASLCGVGGFLQRCAERCLFYTYRHIVE